MLAALRFPPRVALRAVRFNSTASPATPPLMSQMRTDLKTAMRAKDTPRLNVLRALISEYNNAAKTSFPIKTDIQLLSLIRKRLSATKDAAKQFAEADRPDLKEQEDSQAAVLEAYMGQVETMSTEEITQIVEQEVAKLKESGQKLDKNVLFKTLFRPPSVFDGKPADRGEVAKIASRILG